jgi:hypothetical protein
MVQQDISSLVQIMAPTGFLDEERVKYLLLAEAVNERFTTSDLEAVEELVIRVFAGTVLVAVVANMLLITGLNHQQD